METEPAHDPADLVIAFLNTLDVEDGTDELETVHGYRDWLDRHQLGDAARPPTSRDLDAAQELRNALRASAIGAPNAGGGDPRVGLDLALDETGRPRLTSDEPLGRIAAAVAVLAIQDRWDRVKICPADDCRWAFYDRSRNHSRHWCSMAVCGNRAKVRTHRTRRAAS